MTTPTPPSATDAIQKAREPWELRALLKELSERAEEIRYLSSSHPQLASTATDEEKKEMRASFGDKCMQKIEEAHSMAWDMEESIRTLTAERDVALKGYRGMRTEVERVVAPNYGFTDEQYLMILRANCKEAITSSPEIK